VCVIAWPLAMDAQYGGCFSWADAALASTNSVIPAKAGIQFLFCRVWTPAFAGVTKR
jgi:hypothetical protein